MSKIFIIDDDSIHQRIVQIMIAKHQLYDEHAGFTNAEKAVEFIQENKNNPANLPDVILLDLNMPIMDGWDFLDVFENMRHELDKDIRIYVVTSSVDEKDILRTQGYTSVSGFISKPLSPEALRNAH